MSYDLYMLEPVPGEDPMDTLERYEDSDEPETGASEEEVIARNRRIADALLAVNPDYDEFKLQHDEIAEHMRITPEEARAQYRYIELTDESGIQVTIDSTHASITMPYWESLDARKLANEIAKAAKVIGEATGWRVYDPQLEKYIDPVADADEFAAMFGVDVGCVQRIVSEEPAGDASRNETSPKQPWWRRMFGRG